MGFLLPKLLFIRICFAQSSLNCVKYLLFENKGKEGPNYIGCALSYGMCDGIWDHACRDSSKELYI